MAIPGTAIAVSATPATGYQFSGWTVTSGTATIANASSASTTAAFLRAPNQDFKVTTVQFDPQLNEPVYNSTAQDKKRLVLTNDKTTYSYSGKIPTGSLGFSNILVCEEVPDSLYYYDRALNNLGLARTLVTTLTSAATALTNGTRWDLVIINSYTTFIDTTFLTALNAYVNNGGKLIFADWGMYSYPTHNLLRSLGISYVSDFTAPPGFAAVDASHKIFNHPNRIPALTPTDDQYIIDGEIVSVLPGSQQLAAFSGYPSSGAIVLNAGKKCIFNGFQSANFGGDSDSDGKLDIIELLENEITFLSGTNDWLKADPMAGTIPAGGFCTITVSLNAANLFGGLYCGYLELNHNDPLKQNPLSVTCTLIVNGVKRLSAQPISINFGNAWVGAKDTQSITLINSGNEATTISSISCTNPYFVNATPLPLIVPPLGDTTLRVVYQPGSTGSNSGTITITSNAEDNPSIAVALTGSGIAGPNIIVSTDSLYQSIGIGDSASSTLTINNSGGTALNWTITPSDKTQTAAVPSPLYDASHFVALTKGSDDTRIGRSVILSHGGPDRTGYTWIDSDEPGGPVYQWTDIKATGTMLSSVSGCDDCFQAQNISFNFPFYGMMFDTIYVGSNGYITFGTGASAYTNYPLPTTSAPANLIAGLFDDLNTSAGGDIYFKDFGDRAVVQFDNVYPYSGSGVYTFQIVLEKSGSMYLYYNNLTGPLTGATVGIQNATRDDGLPVAYNTSYLKNMLAVQFIPKAAWLGVSPLSGTVTAGQSASVRVSFNGAAVTSGIYYGSLAIFHNDASQNSPLTIPVTLQVTGAAQGMTGRVLSFGVSALPSVSGSRYRIVDLRMGSALTGQAQGSRYRILLK